MARKKLLTMTWGRSGFFGGNALDTVLDPNPTVAPARVWRGRRSCGKAASAGLQRLLELGVKRRGLLRKLVRAISMRDSRLVDLVLARPDMVRLRQDLAALLDAHAAGLVPVRTRFDDAVDDMVRELAVRHAWFLTDFVDQTLPNPGGDAVRRRLWRGR